MSLYTSNDVLLTKWTRIVIPIFVIGLAAIDIVLAFHLKINELQYVPIYCAIVSLGIHGIKDIKLGEYVDYNIVTERYEGRVDDYVREYKAHNSFTVAFSILKSLFVLFINTKINKFWFMIINICLTNLYPAILLFIFVIPFLTLELGSCLKYWVKRIRQTLWPKPEFVPLFNDMTSDSYDTVNV